MFDIWKKNKIILISKRKGLIVFLSFVYFPFITDNLLIFDMEIAQDIYRNIIPQLTCPFYTVFYWRKDASTYKTVHTVHALPLSDQYALVEI